MQISATVGAQTGSIAIPADITGRYQNIRLTWLNNQSVGSTADNNLQINYLQARADGQLQTKKYGDEFTTTYVQRIYSDADPCGGRISCVGEDQQDFYGLRYLIDNQKDGYAIGYHTTGTSFSTFGSTEAVKEVGIIDLCNSGACGTRTINEIGVHFYDAETTRYQFKNVQVEISDGTRDANGELIWDRVFDGNNIPERSFNGLEKFYFSSRAVRYIRILSSGSNVNGYAHLEDVTARLVELPSSANYANAVMGAKVHSSNPHFTNGTYAFSNLIDGDSASYFQGKFAGTTLDKSENEELVEMGVIDLGQERLINTIDLSILKNTGLNNYKIQVATTDPNNASQPGTFTTVIDTSSSAASYEGRQSVQFEAQTVRFIKIFASKWKSAAASEFPRIEELGARYVAETNYANAAMGAKFISPMAASAAFKATVPLPTVVYGWDSVLDGNIDSATGYDTLGRNLSAAVTPVKVNGVVDTEALYYLGKLDLCPSTGTCGASGTRLINEITLHLFDATKSYYYRNIKIQVSTTGIDHNAADWTTIFDGTGMDLNFQGVQRLNFNEREVRFIRFFVADDNNTSNKIVIHEIEARYNKQLDYAQVSMGATISKLAPNADGAIEAKYEQALIDGGTSTLTAVGTATYFNAKVSSVDELMQIAQVDLGSIRMINQVDFTYFMPPTGAAHIYGDYKIEISVNGIDWRTVSNTLEEQTFSGSQIVNFSAQSARYIRLSSTGFRQSSTAYTEARITDISAFFVTRPTSAVGTPTNHDGWDMYGNVNVQNGKAVLQRNPDILGSNAARTANFMVSKSYAISPQFGMDLDFSISGFGISADYANSLNLESASFLFENGPYNPAMPELYRAFKLVEVNDGVKTANFPYFSANPSHMQLWYFSGGQWNLLQDNIPRSLKGNYTFRFESSNGATSVYLMDRDTQTVLTRASGFAGWNSVRSNVQSLTETVLVDEFRVHEGSTAGAYELASTLSGYSLNDFDERGVLISTTNYTVTSTPVAASTTPIYRQDGTLFYQSTNWAAPALSEKIASVNYYTADGKSLLRTVNYFNGNEDSYIDYLYHTDGGYTGDARLYETREYRIIGQNADFTLTAPP
ncbi:MAG TPA: hypothetical protein DIS66_07100, partial [Candidatus Omnitrophica bacterium]|nr:hypothetical protein [Candidatus Omnitrophota bacterium]